MEPRERVRMMRGRDKGKKGIGRSRVGQGQRGNASKRGLCDRGKDRARRSVWKRDGGQW